MSGRPAGALAGIAMILFLAAPAGAAVGRLSAASPLEAPSSLAVPMRDVVWDETGVAAARISASASSQRYPIDGSGTTIEVGVTVSCQEVCTAAHPQRIADFVGTLVHGDEVDLFSVQLDTPYQLGLDCGFGAQACYFPTNNKAVISGNETLARDGADREFVLAHEYGHHVAAHRDLPAPFFNALDWGTERWASVENVCRGKRRGRLFPGFGGIRYFRDPGEAFAEAFAFNRFPDAEVQWRWLPALRPNAASFRAIREDTLSPWRGRSSLVLSGRVPARGEGAAVESLPTPLDGMVTLRPIGLRRHGYELAVRSRAGRLLRHRIGPRPRLDYTVCGQSRLRLVIHSHRPRGTPYRLRIQRP